MNKKKKKDNFLRIAFNTLFLKNLSNSEKTQLIFLLIALYLGTIASSLMPQLSPDESIFRIAGWAFLSWVEAIFVFLFFAVAIIIASAFLIDICKKVWAILIELGKLGQAKPQTQTRS